MTKYSYNRRIADIILARKLVSAEVLEAAQNGAREDQQRLEKYLVDKNLLKSADMTLVLAEYLKMAPMTLANFTPDSGLMDLIPREIMTKRLVVPVARAGRTLTVAMGDPFDLMALDEITALTNLRITPVAAPENDINNALTRLFRDSSHGLSMEEILKDTESDVQVVEEEEDELSLDEMLESAEGAPVIRMVNMMLVDALRTGASDIHIEPMEKKVRLRYRVDGILMDRPSPPKNLQAAVVSRIKIMADMDIAERRIPQDGRFNIKALGKEVDLRVSILPVTHGEKVVMRILDKGTLYGSLSALGLDPVAYQGLEYAIGQPHGIILVTGPTGSGKTTTLYSCLQELNKPDVNIITCEDPVEYQLEGINQVQIRTEVGLTFASALRSILRQDPDVILVGEIRDSETAEIAIKAALTGHLVLSTLHTNDAPGAVTRLLDMGVEPFMLGSCLVLTQAQRLFRKLCVACKAPAEISQQILASNHIDPKHFDGLTIYRAVGCPRCANGYKGRSAIMEVLLVNDNLREAVLAGANTSQIRQIAIQSGMVSLKEAGLNKVRQGITSLEAALEVTGGE